MIWHIYCLRRISYFKMAAIVVQPCCTVNVQEIMNTTKYLLLGIAI